MLFTCNNGTTIFAQGLVLLGSACWSFANGYIVWAWLAAASLLIGSPIPALCYHFASRPFEILVIFIWIIHWHTKFPLTTTLKPNWNSCKREARKCKSYISFSFCVLCLFSSLRKWCSLKVRRSKKICQLSIWEFSNEESLIFRNIDVFLENFDLMELLMFCWEKYQQKC